MIKSFTESEGRYRVLLINIGNNTEEEKDLFCHNVSKNYNIPFQLLKKIVDRSPVVLKKNLTFKKAEILSKTLKSFGATVFVEEKSDSPPIYLEFQELVPHHLELESSSLRRVHRGRWNVLGRVKNISDGILSDVWGILQLFDSQGDFINFEEAPLPINPLPPGEASPFKIMVEENSSIHKITIGFRTASGQPIAALDKRKKREWVKVEIEEEEAIEDASPIDLKEHSDQSELRGVKEPPENSSTIKDEDPLQLELKKDEREEKETVKEILEERITFNTEEGVSERTLEPTEKETPLNQIESPSTTNPLSFPWVEDFKKAVDLYYQNQQDIFSIWFGECRREGNFKDSLHSLLTILVHARFDQAEQPIHALENTQRVFRLITFDALPLEEIPSLEGTSFISGEGWKELFYRAIPRIHEIGKEVLERGKWEAPDLERLIQVIPHMCLSNSRKAILWINKLIPEVVEIDFTGTTLSVNESIYRVASRLGIVDPLFDPYQGSNSIGDQKIQSFAKLVFPHNPMRVEEPLEGMGKEKGKGGHCFPKQPQCDGCLFETFCPRLYFHFNPSDKGMKVSH